MSTKIHKCIDCGGKVSRRFALRCKICSNRLISKEHTGKNSPNYKHGKYCKSRAFCLDCGIKIHRTNVRCSKCWFKHNRGKNHVRWTGNTPIIKSIRNSRKFNQWKIKVFIRDNFICQECKQIGGILHVHHVKYFAKLYAEFLKKYDQFSPIEDKEILVRLAIKWNPFWDINNGKTLCYDCHNIKHPNMNFCKF